MYYANVFALNSCPYFLKKKKKTWRKINYLFKKIFTYLFLERGGGRKRERETSMCGVSHMPPTGDLAHNPGMCHDWELNW